MSIDLLLIVYICLFHVWHIYILVLRSLLHELFISVCLKWFHDNDFQFNHFSSYFRH